jgi:bis(5'-adenosyl)-triphosphatase
MSAEALCRFLRPATVTCLFPLLGRMRELVGLAAPLVRGGYRLVAIDSQEADPSITRRAAVNRVPCPSATLEGVEDCVRRALSSCEAEPRRVALLMDGSDHEVWPWRFTQRELLDCAIHAGLRAVVFNAEAHQFDGVSVSESLKVLPASLSVRDAISALVAGVEPSLLPPSRPSTADAAASLPAAVFGFGPHIIPAGQVFASSKHCLALTNLKPVTPGHVLVITRRAAGRFRDLTAAEVSDLWLTVQAVSERLEAFLGADSVTVALQDGPAAGQTVPHIHVHILPRHVDDIEDNDAVYDMVRRNKASDGMWR